MREKFSKRRNAKLSLFAYNFSFFVGLFVRINPIVCLCGVITRSYFSIFISQLCNTVVCLIPKMFSDIRFRMKDARFLLVNIIS